MTVLTKIFYIFLLVLMLPTFIFSILSNMYIYDLKWSIGQIPIKPFLGNYLELYLFWSNLVFTSLIIILIFIVLFYPRLRKEILFPKDNGQLVIKKKAIDQFIQSLLEQEEWIKNPKVSSKLDKNKIKVLIRGDFNKSIDLEEKSSSLNERMSNELKNLLNIKKDKNISLELRQYVSDNLKKNRVV